MISGWLHQRHPKRPCHVTDGKEMEDAHDALADTKALHAVIADDRGYLPLHTLLQRGIKRGDGGAKGLFDELLSLSLSAISDGNNASSLLLSALSVRRPGHPAEEMVNPPEVIAQLIALHPEAVEPQDGQCPLFAALTADKSKTAELVVRMLAVPEAVKFKRDGDENALHVAARKGSSPAIIAHIAAVHDAVRRADGLPPPGPPPPLAACKSQDGKLPLHVALENPNVTLASVTQRALTRTRSCAESALPIRRHRIVALRYANANGADGWARKSSWRSRRAAPLTECSDAFRQMPCA